MANLDYAIYRKIDKLSYLKHAGCARTHILYSQPQTKENGHSASTPALPAQNVMSSKTDVDAEKMRELNDMDKPTRHILQISSDFF